MWRWLGRLLLHSVYLLLANMFAVRILALAYAMLIRAGALLPPNLLAVHILWRSLFVGFLAGILPVALLLAGVGWLKPLPLDLKPRSVTSQPQFWTWIPYSFWMIYGMGSWILANWNHSVLSKSDGPPITGAYRTFFTDPCGLSGTWIDLLACRYQIEFTAVWVVSVGYSLAAIPFFMRSHSVSQIQNDENPV
jgi:hypothetical protein